MKTKWYLIIGFSLIFILSFSVPFIILCELKIRDKLSIATSISASIATFLTLIIVILFFDKFGLHKTVFDKTQNQIIKLIDEISELRFRGRLRESRYPNFTFSRLNLEYFKNDPELSDKEILFTGEYWTKLLDTVGKIQSSVWTPKAIKHKLSGIIPNSLGELKEYNHDKNIILTFGNKSSFIGLFNDERILISDYILRCEDLLDEINKWLKKYGGKPNDFEF